MTASAPKVPTCSHYYIKPVATPQLGGPPVRHNVPMCKLLERLEATDELRHNMVCDQMAQAGGSSMVTTGCAFEGQPRCPAYQP